jgi:DNA-binding CsgD family transcriptional regulator
MARHRNPRNLGYAGSVPLTEDLRDLDRGTGPLPDRQREIARLFAHHLGADAASVTTVDPATLLTTRCELFGVPKEPRFDETFGRLEYLPGDDDMLLPNLVQLPDRATTLLRSTEGDPNRCARWVEALRPYGVADELRCALVARGSCWGTLNLFRTRGSFSDVDLATVVRLAPLLVETLRRGMLQAVLGEPDLVDRPPGLARVDAHGEVVPVSSEAQRWLDAGGEALRSAVRQLLASGQAGGPTDAIVADGTTPRFHVHFTLLDDRPAVVIEVPRPAELAERIVRAWGLSVRERDVLSLVLRGRSTGEVAEALGISAWTVQDHLKRVFDKSGHSSRREVMATLFSDHALPEMKRGSRPSPYGWFLGETGS